MIYDKRRNPEFFNSMVNSRNDLLWDTTCLINYNCNMDKSKFRTDSLAAMVNVVLRFGCAVDKITDVGVLQSYIFV